MSNTPERKLLLNISFREEIMSRVIDETGHIYGNLTVLSRAESDNRGQARWNCQCKCGNKVIVNGKHLRSGHTTSCGCRMRTAGYENQKVKAGDRFGYLTVIELTGRSPLRFLCQCECGNRIEVLSKYLRQGKSSCGCKKSSNGELFIEKLLSENHISFEREKTFSDLVSMKDHQTPYRYDFFLPDFKTLIEVDGLQHVSTVADNFFNRSHKELARIDEIKNQYAKNNGYNLLRIPYTKVFKTTIKDILSLIEPQNK